MVDPATISAIAKAIGAALKDERFRKAIGWIIAAILSPVILFLVFLLILPAGMADHNTAAVDACFFGVPVGKDAPAEFRMHIADMQKSFSQLESEIFLAEMNGEGEKLDSVRMKAIFYSLFFGEEQPSAIEQLLFVGCFVRNEERTRIVTVKDEAGNEVEKEETYWVSVPIQDLNEVYINLSMAFGKNVTEENRSNAAQIYSLALYGNNHPVEEGITQEEWSASIGDPDTYLGTGDFASPLGAGWEQRVRSEFGWRRDPFGSGKGEGHSGLDMAAAKGFPIQAARSGIVAFVKNSGSQGYGYHLAMDHGDGMVTLYAHCSQILVRAGQEVQQGDVIAAVGSTGRSTGAHLHLEVRINGKKLDPRLFLPNSLDAT